MRRKRAKTIKNALADFFMTKRLHGGILKLI